MICVLRSDNQHVFLTEVYLALISNSAWSLLIIQAQMLLQRKSIRAGKHMG